MSKETGNIIPKSTLFVDIGNSSIKTAFQVEMEWHPSGRYRLDQATDLLDWFNQHSQKFQLVVISSVVGKVTDILTERIGDGKCRVLGISDIPADLLDYETPETLGIDRFFACYGAVAHTSKPAVVIDAGSACTIDYMSADYIYRGGVIMAGISAVERALKAHAPALPHVSRSVPGDWPGRSTETSLQWGITGTFVDGIRACLNRYEERFDDFDLILTGGDAEWISSVIQRDFRVRPLLVFEGMKRFLEDYL